jgi:hypothetical protein
MHTTRQGHLAGILVILLIGIFHFATLREGHPWGDDFAQYILHARNLVTGVPYAQTGYIFNPYEIVTGPPAYPPVTALLLAPAYALSGADYFPMKLIMIACLMASLFFFWKLIQPRLALWQSLAVVAAVGIAPAIWEYTNMVGSELPFLAFSFLALYLMDRPHRVHGPGPPPLLAGWALLTGAAMYLSYATRSVGMILPPVLLLTEWIRYRRVSRFGVLAAGVAVAAMVIQSVTLRSESNYVTEIGRPAGVIAQGIVINAWNYFRESSGFWSNGYSRLLAVGLYFLTLPLAAAGFVRSIAWRERISAMDVYFVVSFGPLLIYPTVPGVRYFLPLFPIYIFYLFAGAVWLGVWRPQPLRWAPIGLAAALWLSYAGWYSQATFTPFPDGLRDPQFREMVRYVETGTDPGARFMFRKPRLLALASGRAAAMYPRDEAGQVFELIQAERLTHVITANLPLLDFETDREFLQPLVNAHPERFHLIYENGPYQIYQIAH